MDFNLYDLEIKRMESVYSQREYDTDPEYTDANPVYLHRIHSMERAALSGLKACGLEKKLAQLKILDFGTGNGRWFGRWIAWGATPSNLAGIDLRAKAVEMAHDTFPNVVIRPVVEGRIPFDDGSFDIVYQNIAFSSILDNTLRRNAALEISRVLRPGGVLLWCDIAFNNPANKNIKSVKLQDVLALFPKFKKVRSKKVILAPPLAKLVVPVSWLMADFLESCVPLLRTHIFAVLQK